MTFSSRFAEKIAKVAGAFLQHTCTLINFTATGDEDDTNEPTYTPTILNDVRCLLLWRDVATDDGTGNVLTRTPLLYLEEDQVVSEGSIVKDVLNRNGTNILEQAKINTIDTTSEGGGASLKVAQLEGAQI